MRYFKSILPLLLIILTVVYSQDAMATDIYGTLLQKIANSSLSLLETFLDEINKGLKKNALIMFIFGMQAVFIMTGEIDYGNAQIDGRGSLFEGEAVKKLIGNAFWAALAMYATSPSFLPKIMSEINNKVISKVYSKTEQESLGAFYTEFYRNKASKEKDCSTNMAYYSIYVFYGLNICPKKEYTPEEAANGISGKGGGLGGVLGIDSAFGRVMDIMSGITTSDFFQFSFGILLSYLSGFIFFVINLVLYLMFLYNSFVWLMMGFVANMKSMRMKWIYSAKNIIVFPFISLFFAFLNGMLNKMFMMVFNF